MGRLTGRVAIVTGAGRGLGRSHALELASHGAKVVVNDLGAGLHGEAEESTPAGEVVAEIRAAGGEAVVSAHDVSNWDQANELVRLAVETFGDLHVLVNNAGILRDRTLANMSEDEWDAVLRVHLKGHAATSRHAMAYWREQAKEGNLADRSVVHTSSVSGYRANFGQANYGAAKLGIVGLSGVVALEGARYGIRSNVVAPSARTRMALSVEPELDAPADPNEFDSLHPGNVSPLVAWLAAPECPATAQLFHLGGSRLTVFSLPPVIDRIETTERWTLEGLDEMLSSRLVAPMPINELF